MWSVGSNEIWTHRIVPYLFGYVIRSGLLYFDPTVKKEGEGLPVRLGLGLQSPARNSGEGALEVDDGELLATSG
jgi:hypothetical protein